jgi:hypothetical protein
MPSRKIGSKASPPAHGITVASNHGVIAGSINGPVSISLHHPDPRNTNTSQGSQDRIQPPNVPCPNPALAALLCSLFDSEELVRFLNEACPDDDLSAELPSSSLATTVHAAITALRRRGRLDVNFFKALVHARPGRQQDIEALAALSMGRT